MSPTLHPPHLAGFSQQHIAYLSRPPCALFPIEACRIPPDPLTEGNLSTLPFTSSDFRRPWLTLKRPLEPICLNMELCFMPNKHSRKTLTGVVAALAGFKGGWSVWWIKPHDFLFRAVLLYVPVVWVDLTHIPPSLCNVHWYKFHHFTWMPFHVLNSTLEQVSVPSPLHEEDERMTYHAITRSSSCETITPASYASRYAASHGEVSYSYYICCLLTRALFLA